MAISRGPRLLNSGLILAYDAGDINSYIGSGTSWVDISRNSNNGTLTNSPTFSSTNVGNVVFNGTNQYVAIANSSSLQVGDVFTICAWIKATNLSARYGIFSTRTNNTTGCWQFEVGTGSGGTNRVLVTGIGTFICESNNDVIIANSWYYISFVKVSNSINGGTLYVNGAAISNLGTAAYSIANNTDEKRIAIGTGAAQYFPGSIAQVHFYNTALSASQILQNYNATKSRFGL